MARKTEEDRKYVEAHESFEDYYLDETALDTTDAEDLARLLLWAIKTKQEGFRLADTVSVSAMARAFNTSRVKISDAVQRVVDQGMLRQREKAPYEIVSDHAVFPETDERMGRRISITQQMGRHPGGDIVADFGCLELDRVKKYFPEHAEEHLNAIGERSRVINGADTSPYLFCRYRYITDGESSLARVWWSEATLVVLPEPSIKRLQRHIRRRRKNEERDRDTTSRFSFYATLAKLSVNNFLAERNRVTIGTTPAVLKQKIEKMCEEGSLGRDGCELTADPVVCLSLGHYTNDLQPPGLFALTVCYVDPSLVEFYIHDFQISPPGIQT